jgi:hyperosmotically inducible periplasmic protein
MNTPIHTNLVQGSWLRAGVVAAVVAAGLTTVAVRAQTGDQAPVAHSDSVGAAISDTKITAGVKAKFVGVDALKNSHIHVKTTNGVVTLTGTAATSAAKSTAEDMAKDVDGVRSVDNELATPGSASRTHRAVAKTERVGSDSWITTKVKSELLKDSVSRGSKVHVKTLHGVVMLTGTVADEAALDHVKDLAQNVRGVKSVDTDGLKTAAQ